MDALTDPRFGRCSHFVIVDTDTMEHKVIENDAAIVSSGAGIRAAQAVTSENVDAIITGHVGPNAYSALEAAGIKMLTGSSGSVFDAVEDFKQGKLTSLSDADPATVGTGWGGGRGGGRRRARGGGRN
jgi:predicted Fe-Mo cluster-binding NifX family protein